MRIFTAFSNYLVLLTLACQLAFPLSAAAAPPQELAPE